MNHWLEVAIHVGIILVVAVAVRFIARRAIRRAVTASSVRRIRKVTKATSQTLDGQQSQPASDARATAVFEASGVSPKARAASRADTISGGLCLLVDWVVIIVVVLTVLGEVGVSLAPLLTSAGIGGLIIGVGAQSLIRDLIAGVFLIVEGQYGVGDTIDTGAVRGVVQDVGTRVTKLQSADGEIWYIRNGDISTLGNRSQGWVTSNVVVSVPLGRDPAQVIATLRRICDEVDADPAWHGQLLRPPVVVGMTDSDRLQMIFTIKVSCPQASPVEHEIRARAVAALAEPVS